jgi:hypothetical protein
LFGGIIKLFYVFIVAWLLYRLYTILRGSTRIASRRRSSSPKGGRLEAGELVQDPHCGVYVPKETAVKGPSGDHFCSEACRDAHDGSG